MCIVVFLCPLPGAQVQCWGAFSHSSCVSGKGTVVCTHEPALWKQSSCQSASLSHPEKPSRGGLSLLFLVPWCWPSVKVERTQPTSSVSSQHFQIHSNTAQSHRQSRLSPRSSQSCGQAFTRSHVSSLL